MLPQYCSDMTALMAALGAVEIRLGWDFIGRPHRYGARGLPGSPIRRIVINDIGPYLRGLDYFASAPTSMRLQRVSKLSRQRNCIFVASWRRSENCKMSIGII